VSGWDREDIIDLTPRITEALRRTRERTAAQARRLTAAQRQGMAQVDPLLGGDDRGLGAGHPVRVDHDPHDQ
jgi:hypothetical protein